ncbi:unnamed protein product [Linum tenue]|uniref:Ultraviolet-B-repressible protein n=1 Tax=Linum tenue TaxID=586396 RepID=A0AAV0S5R7_9ROSI|nr:unnamed protein product [Linum tenue]
MAASTSAVSMSMPLTYASQNKIPAPQGGFLSFKPLPPASSSSSSSNAVRASFREKAVTGLTAAALTASMVIPEVAEAAEVSPSLKNFLLSIIAGGVVLTAIIGAIVGVSNFDPVKRT